MKVYIVVQGYFNEGYDISGVCLTFEKAEDIVNEIIKNENINKYKKVDIDKWYGACEFIEIVEHDVIK
jgi:hypothetical protein